jgi:mono/diheme cytochrome c family protein
MNEITLPKSRMDTPLLLAGLILGFMLVQPAWAEQHNANWGASLHQAECAGCHKAPHNAAFYESRRGKKLKSRASVFTMVQSCANHFNIAWFDEEVDAVTVYLNTTYYKYE